MSAPTRQEVYDPAVLMWYDLCPPCRGLFERWRDAPNPAPLLDPRVQQYPHLMAFLASCRAGGPSDESWRETVSWQLLHIRRLCTAGKHYDQQGGNDA